VAGEKKMKITQLESFLANAGLRNYLFIRIHTDTGITGVGEASLEWQEKTVQTVLHEWVEDRILGCDPFDIELIVTRMIRDQYQGGSTIMTAISGVEIALWDIIGKACNVPVYKLMGGRYHQRIPAYANGWYSGAQNPEEYAKMAKKAVKRGYKYLKFDPFGIAWKEMNQDEIEMAVDMVAAIRDAVGPKIGLMIEYHGRLSVPAAVEMIRRLEKYNPTWSEEPVTPLNLDHLAAVKSQVSGRIAAGERLYTLDDFYRLASMRAADIVQMDIAHCGGLSVSKKIAAFCEAQDIQVAPHSSVGPVSLAAALHFDVSTPNFMVQEAFLEFDVPWSTEFVQGWNPIKGGEFYLTDQPGLGIDLDLDVIADHPYVKNSFPSLWNGEWLMNFKQDD
jgi:galactonate dehydratase